MNLGSFDRYMGLAMRNMALVGACLLLTVCAGPPPTVEWVKAGVDDATVSREIDDCRAQANRALTRQQGINQDISATLGRNWQMSQTTGIQRQSMKSGRRRHRRSGLQQLHARQGLQETGLTAPRTKKMIAFPGGWHAGANPRPFRDHGDDAVDAPAEARPGSRRTYPQNPRSRGGRPVRRQHAALALSGRDRPAGEKDGRRLLQAGLG